MTNPRSPQIRIVKIDPIAYPTSQPGIYIGRRTPGSVASPLANPYSVQEHGRLRAVELYREWLQAKVAEKDPEVLGALTEIRDQFRAGYDVTLKCWCFPNLCHGEIIREAVLTWEF